MYIFDFGERLKDLRIENGYTQQELADKLNVSHNTIVRWENNYKVPTKNHIMQLSELFCTSLDYLVGINKKRSIVVSHLTEDQINILNSLVTEFQFARNETVISKRQMDILNGLITEFTK